MELSAENRRVQEALAAAGSSARVEVLGESTRTANDAARAVGCPLGAIVKSLLFLAEGQPVLVLASGDRQVDTARLAGLLGIGRKKLKMADVEAVRRHTSYAVGGVPPLSHPQRLPTYVDSELARFDKVYAAAGSANAVFAIDREELVRMVGGRLADITRGGSSGG
jgi:prolyl-tRNA editing enzyme YbaK/EbsC (Cys-tRNA(Pro) deacylase)